MKKSETIKIIAMLAAAYPNAKPVSEPMVDIWHEALKDLDAQEALLAIKGHIMESPFFPTIHDIRAQIANIKAPVLEPGEAWALVQKGIKKFGYYQEAEALATMDPATRAAVKAMGWQHICHTPIDNLGTLRAQFFKIYDGVKNREYKQALLPAGMQDEIKQLAERLSLTGGTQNEG